MYIPSVSSVSVSEFYKALTLKAPSVAQLKLFDSGMCGVSTNERDEEQAIAVLVLGLHKSRNRNHLDAWYAERQKLIEAKVSEEDVFEHFGNPRQSSKNRVGPVQVWRALTNSSQFKAINAMEKQFGITPPPASIDASKNEFNPVIFAVPRTHEKWMMKVVQDFLKGCLNTHKKGCPNHYTQVKKGLSQALPNLRIGQKVFTLPGEPEHWVSFGFPKEPPTPEWMRSKLL